MVFVFLWLENVFYHPAQTAKIAMTREGSNIAPQTVKNSSIMVFGEKMF